jgi:aryl-alcohol dehydrogenase-like predicted oxidoreductase
VKVCNQPSVLSCLPELNVVDFIPIAGTKHVKYLKDNAGAVDVQLSKDDEQRIRKAIDSIGGTKGGRYPKSMLDKCFGDTAELEDH